MDKKTETTENQQTPSATNQQTSSAIELDLSSIPKFVGGSAERKKAIEALHNALPTFLRVCYCISDARMLPPSMTQKMKSQMSAMQFEEAISHMNSPINIFSAAAKAFYDAGGDINRLEKSGVFLLPYEEKLRGLGEITDDTVNKEANEEE